MGGSWDSRFRQRSKACLGIAIGRRFLRSWVTKCLTAIDFKVLKILNLILGGGVCASRKKKKEFPGIKVVYFILKRRDKYVEVGMT